MKDIYFGASEKTDTAAFLKATKLRNVFSNELGKDFIVTMTPGWRHDDKDIVQVLQVEVRRIPCGAAKEHWSWDYVDTLLERPRECAKAIARFLVGYEELSERILNHYTKGNENGIIVGDTTISRDQFNA